MNSDPNATNVCVAGDFNEWDSRTTPLARQTDGSWYVERDVFDTWYAYKFVVDQRWVVDPDNTNFIYDGDVQNSKMWASNCLISLRPARHPARSAPVSVLFTLTNQPATHVFVAGEFNSWNTESLPMKRRTEVDWTCETRMPPGAYGYKFVVDGQWILDPTNPLTKVVNGTKNSLIVVTNSLAP